MLYSTYLFILFYFSLANQVSHYLDIHSEYIYRIHLGSNRRICCASYEKTEQTPYTWKISVPKGIEGTLVSYNGMNCIQPRKGYLTYLTPGTFKVTCDLRTKSGKSTGISKTKTVHLVGGDILGWVSNIEVRHRSNAWLGGKVNRRGCKVDVLIEKDGWDICYVCLV
ncbi:unnamed protein product [Trichobilharzia regenti]|nr:unnamed protein product [Trichobilharzia regenti]